MRINKICSFLILSAMVVFHCSCSTGKVISKSTRIETVKKDSTVSTVDITSVQSIKIDSKTSRFGDTLNGSLSFTLQQITPGTDSTQIESDSLESTGIKIVVSVVKDKNGGVKASIKAVSKPKEIIDTHTELSTEKKGVSTTTKSAVNSTTTQNDSTKTKKGFPWVWAIGIGAFLIIILIIIILKKIYG